MRKLWMLSALGLLVMACGKEVEAPPQVPMVRTTVVEASSSMLELRGSVASAGRMKLGFKAPGILDSIRVREGDSVHPGQVLAVLNEVDARSQMLSAKAALDRARRDSERSERLVKEGALPLCQWQDARNQLEACEAQWNLAQDALKRTRIVAPTSGTVFQRLAEPGEAVAAGTPVLVVDTTSQLVVRAGLTEREWKCLRKDQIAHLIPEDGSPGFQGRVRALSSVPAQDGLYSVEIFPEAAIRLLPGALLKVQMEKVSHPGLRIPIQALVHRQDQDFVFVVDGAVAGMCKARMRKVRIDRSEGAEICVGEGLSKGDRVVSEGAYFLQDAAPIRVQE